MTDSTTDQDDDAVKKAGAGESIDSGKGRVFPCDECGADLQFSIGTQTMKCPYCGAVKTIEVDEEAEIVEHDFHAMLEQLQQQKLQGIEVVEETDEHAVRCSSCGAEVVFQGTLTSTECPY